MGPGLQVPRRGAPEEPRAREQVRHRAGNEHQPDGCTSSSATFGRRSISTGKRSISLAVREARQPRDLLDDQHGRGPPLLWTRSAPPRASCSTRRAAAHRSLFDSHLWRWQMAVGSMFARLFLIEGDLARADTHLTEGLAIAERTESRRHLAEGIPDPRGDLVRVRAGGRRPDRASPCARVRGGNRRTANHLGDRRRPRSSARTRPGGRGSRRLPQGARSAAWRAAEDSPPRAQDTLLRSEPVAQLIEEAARLGVTLPPDQPQRPAPPPATPR